MKKSALSDILGGLIILALGLSFFLATNDIIPKDKWWSYLLTFLGLIFLFDAVMRNWQLKEHLFGGRFIAGIILFVLGLAFVLTLKNWWPIILILVGILIILKGVFGHREVKSGEAPKS